MVNTHGWWYLITNQSSGHLPRTEALPLQPHPWDAWTVYLGGGFDQAFDKWKGQMVSRSCLAPHKDREQETRPLPNAQDSVCSHTVFWLGYDKTAFTHRSPKGQPGTYFTQEKYGATIRGRSQQPRSPSCEHRTRYNATLYNIVLWMRSSVVFRPIFFASLHAPVHCPWTSNLKRSLIHIVNILRLAPPQNHAGLTNALPLSCWPNCQSQEARDSLFHIILFSQTRCPPCSIHVLNVFCESAVMV